jgi:carbamoyltransferase
VSRNVIGINWYAHDASAALLQDGVVTFASTEERFSRIKKDNSFPEKVVAAAFQHAGITIDDVDAIAFGWNAAPATSWHTLRASLTGALPRRGEYIPRALAGIITEMGSRSPRRQLRRRYGELPNVSVQNVDHHLAHAYSAFAVSGFDEAAVLVVDGRGAWQSTTLYHAVNGELRPVRVISYPNSLGLFYEAFTDLLGFERHADEWKVMGLAAYGKPNVPLDALIRITDDGYAVDAHGLMGRYWSDLSPLEARFGRRRNPERGISDADRDLAASVQRSLEEAMLSLVRDARRRVPSRNLCLAGGVAMNSKANGRILASGLVDRLFVQPAATDDGTALGAALAADHQLTGTMPRHQMTNAYLGNDVSQAEIDRTLKLYGIPHIRCVSITRAAARLISEGEIIGWFQGRMEFGPRALGCRSILADPRDPDMKDRVNDSIKYREGWRPFAPSVLAERATDYFEPDGDSPFMILTHTVRSEKRSIIPAVTHVDNTARVQTVERSVNPLYWELISELEAITGVPVVMNTSFNLRGEPIVSEPKDAIRTFFSSGLTFLALGNCLIAKDPSALARIAAADKALANMPLHRGDHAHTDSNGVIAVPS